MLRRARERVLAAAHQRAQQVGDGQVGLVACASASSASSRITVSIVPSTGLRTAR